MIIALMTVYKIVLVHGVDHLKMTSVEFVMVIIQAVLTVPERQMVMLM